jgi:hypothetical protein
MLFPQLSEVLQELPRLIVETWKHLIQCGVPQMPVDGFAEYSAEICGDRQVPSFIEL